MLALGLASLCVAGPAQAYPGGIATPSCSGCHAEPGFDGAITLSPEGALQPGVKTDFTLTVRESAMAEAGFYLTLNGGVGQLSAGTGSRLTVGDLVQARPAAAADHVSEFHFSYTPPTEPGGIDFWVAVIAANNDGSSAGDRSAQARFSRTWGCGDGITLFQDDDGDGYGLDDDTSAGCEAREGWAVVGGDCNGAWSSIYPGAPEQANGKDDNCDGEIDEGIEFALLYPDRDGDGYGTGLSEPIESLGARDGYAPNSDDCDDTRPLAYPGAEEVCDGYDNDCDGDVDEDTYEMCGVGRCARLLYICDHACVPGEPLTEVCNGLDDDCDGETDEGELCPAGQICDIDCVTPGAVTQPEPDPTVQDPATPDPGSGGASTTPVTTAGAGSTAALDAGGVQSAEPTDSLPSADAGRASASGADEGSSSVDMSTSNAQAVGEPDEADTPGPGAGADRPGASDEADASAPSGAAGARGAASEAAAEPGKTSRGGCAFVRAPAVAGPRLPVGALFALLGVAFCRRRTGVRARSLLGL